MPKIWVIETGEYEQRYVTAVASTVESGVAHIKAECPEINHWEEIKPDGLGGFKLRGHACPAKYRDEQQFDFTAHELV